MTGLYALPGKRIGACIIPGDLPNECCTNATYNSLHVEPGVLNALGDKLKERCRVSTFSIQRERGRVWRSE